MLTKTYKIIWFLALSGLFFAFTSFIAAGARAVENMPVTAIADKVVLPSKTLPAGFYQFNNLEILKGPVADEPPAVVEVIQKNSNSCFVYENGKTDRPISCVFNGNQDNNYVVQIEERTTLLGVNQEPALLTDFQAGDKIGVLGWLSVDSKIIRSAVVKSLESKNFHQSLSGTVKKVEGDGFTITLANGDEILVKTPIVAGAQVTIKGVFDKVNNAVSNVLSIFVRPTIVLREKPIEESIVPTPAPSAKPSTLFRNFLKVFGL